VWIEPVPEKHIEALLITPDVDRKQLRLSVAGVGTSADDRIQATAFDGSRVVAKAAGRVGEELTLSLDAPKLWSPESPFLYDFRVVLLPRGKRPIE
jgi:beta-galactosidase/beta-glucuronidase